MTTDKPLLLIYADGALRIAHIKLREGATVYEEAVYLGRTRRWDPSDTNPVAMADEIMTRTFVKRGETARYAIYEEWS